MFESSDAPEGGYHCGNGVRSPAGHGPKMRRSETPTRTSSLADACPVDIPRHHRPGMVARPAGRRQPAEPAGHGPDRIRRCAHPDCVLFFYDTSKNGTRRWHSMATCGNRTKAARHYAKKS